MNFAEHAPSQRWAGLTYRGERFAEVWFKPEGDPCALIFRLPQQSFQRPDLAPLLTPANLLAAVAVGADQGEVYRMGDEPADLELDCPLPPPAPDVAHLVLHVRVQPPAPSAEEGGAAEVPLEQVQDLEARWHAILAVESAIEQLRLRVESAQGEMDGAAQRVLTTDEKLYAPNADVLQWNKAKGRARYAQPKAKEFIHRATWVIGTPERKQLGELFKDGLRRDLSGAALTQLSDELARTLKAHQVLAGQGTMVHQECKGITAEIQTALRTLLNNSAANAQKKRVASHKKGKYV